MGRKSQSTGWQHHVATRTRALLGRRGPLRNRTYRAKHGLDRTLESLLDVRRGGYFVELGANDGLRQSNTYFLEKRYGWSGVLIEPALNNYLKLLRNRSSNNVFFCTACVAFDYPEPFVRLRYADLMSVTTSVETDLPDINLHVERTRLARADRRTAVEFAAPAAPLSQLLDRAEAPTVIDLLSIDVEGAELEVLRGIDHERHRFKHLLVESRDLDRMEGFLAGVDYRMSVQLSHHDFLFVDGRSPAA